ncbi:PREDICTED: ubiquitin-like [Camelina sativa]|uniref:Ubiquitin-like n=1 Tax=Camelina sativa TaxID=90675 RepID=A0ABM1QVQ6_CAMSA|nr:PREDICTED: ubiquitin-like [Camelina sativa]
MQISIKTLKGKSINLEVDDSSNSIDLKIHGEPMRGLVLRLGPVPDPSPSEAFRIFVSTLGGTTSTFMVKRSVTIGKIKAKIEEKDGILVKDQILIFEGKRLDDSLTIADCDIEDESTLLSMVAQCGC